MKKEIKQRLSWVKLFEEKKRCRIRLPLLRYIPSHFAKMASTLHFLANEYKWILAGLLMDSFNIQRLMIVPVTVY